MLLKLKRQTLLRELNRAVALGLAEQTIARRNQSQHLFTISELSPVPTAGTQAVARAAGKSSVLNGASKSSIVYRARQAKLDHLAFRGQSTSASGRKRTQVELSGSPTSPSRNAARSRPAHALVTIGPTTLDCNALVDQGLIPLLPKTSLQGRPRATERRAPGTTERGSH